MDLLLSFGFDKLAGPAYVPAAWTPFEPSKTVANPRGKGRQSRSSRSCSPTAFRAVAGMAAVAPTPAFASSLKAWAYSKAKSSFDDEVEFLENSRMFRVGSCRCVGYLAVRLGSCRSSFVSCGFASCLPGLAAEGGKARHDTAQCKTRHEPTRTARQTDS